MRMQNKQQVSGFVYFSISLCMHSLFNFSISLSLSYSILFSLILLFSYSLSLLSFTLFLCLPHPSLSLSLFLSFFLSPQAERKKAMDRIRAVKRKQANTLISTNDDTGDVVVIVESSKSFRNKAIVENSSITPKHGAAIGYKCVYFFIIFF